MSLNEVTSKIDEEIKSGEFMLQAVFNRNIQAIEMLKLEGYSYKTIHGRLTSVLNERHFRSLVFNARKSINLKKTPIGENQNKNIIHTPESNVTTSKSVINNVVDTEESTTTIEEWSDFLGFRTTERALEKISKLNLSKKEVLAFNIPTQRRLINYLNQLIQKSKSK